tara:strand:+ start:389 stop:988 length:600 start_codon:yes stop_codon:yes gene_type:complete
MQFPTLNITTVSGPTSLAAGALSDLKAHLRVTSTHEDDVIKMYFESASSLVERVCGISISERTYQLNLPGFPIPYRFIELPRGPVSSVGSMYYYDTDNTSTLWASSDYDVALDMLPARIYLQESDSWESTYDRPDAVRVQYTTGFGSTWDDIPDRVRVPLFYLVAHQHRFRQPVITQSATDLPWGLRMNLQSLREDFHT